MKPSGSLWKAMEAWFMFHHHIKRSDDATTDLRWFWMCYKEEIWPLSRWPNSGCVPHPGCGFDRRFYGGLIGSGYKWQDKATWDSCYTSERFCLAFLMVIDVLFREVSRSYWEIYSSLLLNTVRSLGETKNESFQRHSPSWMLMPSCLILLIQGSIWMHSTSQTKAPNLFDCHSRDTLHQMLRDYPLGPKFHFYHRSYIGFEVEIYTLLSFPGAVKLMLFPFIYRTVAIAMRCFVPIELFSNSAKYQMTTALVLPCKPNLWTVWVKLNESMGQWIMKVSIMKLLNFNIYIWQAMCFCCWKPIC